MSSNKIAVVTGGSQAVGRAIALKLAAEGFTLAILSRSAERLATTAEEIRATGVACTGYVCDVGNWQEVDATFSKIRNDFGGVDVLINNAGGWMGDTIADVDPIKFKTLLDASVLGSVFCSKAAIPLMRERSGAFILNIGSTSGLLTTTDFAAASTPKGAVEIFTRTLAREVEADGIRVSAIHPAHIDKELPKGDPVRQDSEGNYTAITQWQVADLVAFVISQPPNVFIRELVVTPTNISL